MDNEFDPFSGYAGDTTPAPPPSPSPAIPAPIGSIQPASLPEDTAEKSSNPFDGFSDDGFQAGMPPNAFERAWDNIKYGFNESIQKYDSARAASTIAKANEGGVAQPGESPFAGKPSQQEVDNALGTLAKAKMENDRFEGRKQDEGGESSAIIGSLLGGLAAPENVPLMALGGPAFNLVGRTLGAGVERLGASELLSAIAERAGEFGSFGATADAIEQGLEVKSGQSDGVDYQRLALSTLLGAGFGASMEGISHAIKGVSGRLPEQIGSALDGFSKAPVEAASELPPTALTPPMIDGVPIPDHAEPTQAVAPPPVAEPIASSVPPELAGPIEHAKAIYDSLTPEAKAAAERISDAVGIPRPAQLAATTPDSSGIVSGAVDSRFVDHWTAPVQMAHDEASAISAIPPQNRTTEIPAYSKELDATLTPKAPDAPAGRAMFNAADLATDAQRFQFKEDGDESGVTTRLKGVTKWDEAKANQAIVWEQNDGKLFVVDGHQRVGLAKRLIEQGHEKNISIPGLLYREKDGISADDIRAIAAAKNIGEGSGSALDGAKVLRSRPDLLDGSLPLSVGKSRQAYNLARLDDEAFRMVVNDVVPEHQAALVGDIIPNDGPRQNAAMKAIARFEPRNEAEATALIQRVNQSELARENAGRQGSMFGDLESADSTAGEEMKIVGRATADLKKDKALFSRVLNNAGRLEETGSHIERGAAQGAAQDAETFGRILSSEAYAAGPVRDELVAAARELKNGEITIGEASERIRAALGRAIEDAGDAGIGNRGRSLEIATEKTEAGNQGLIPGVDPITDRQRLEAKTGRPMEGGDAPPLEGGLFDENARNQQEMFLRGNQGRKPIGPNEADRRLSVRSQLPGENASIVGPREVVSDVEARNLKLQSTMKSIADRLGRRVEFDGRLRGGALGSYKPLEGVLRVRYAGDIETFSHELGHAIDQMLSNDPATKAAWRAIRTAKPSELYKMDYNATVTGAAPTIEEGVAEFLRTYITNPAYAQTHAPMTADAFRAILAKQPKLAGILSDTANMAKVEGNLTPMQAATSMIAETPHSAWGKMRAQMKMEGIVPTIADYFHQAYEPVIGQDHTVARFAKALRELEYQKTGKAYDKVNFSDDPYVLVRRLPGAEQAAIGAFKDGVHAYGDPMGAPVSPSLQGALNKALNGALSRIEDETDPLIKDFNGYLVSRRAAGEWQRYESGELRNQPVRMSKNEVTKAISDFEAKHPQFKDAADDVFSFMRANFQKQVDAGIISKDIADAVLGRGGDYVPFWRDFEGEKVSSSRGGRGDSGLAQSPVQTFGGSTRDILNPIRSIIESVSIGERMIARNEVYLALDKMAENAGELAGPLWEKIPSTEIKGQTVDIAEAIRANVGHNGGPPMDADMAISQLENMIGTDLTATLFRHQMTTARGERIISFFKGGERQFRKIGDSEMAKRFFDTMTVLSAPERDVFLKTLFAANHMLQGMIVHAPRFLIGTLVRDNMTRIFTPRYMSMVGRIPFAQDVVGAHALLFDREFYKAYAANGGIRGGVYANAARNLHTADPLEAITASHNSYRRFQDDWGRAGISPKFKAVLSTPGRMVHDALRMIEGAETVSRVGVAKMTSNYLQKQGLTREEALIGAIHESQDVLPYGRAGNRTSTVTRLVPFLGAGIQGADRAARGLIAEPIQAALMAYRRGGYANLDAAQKLQLANAGKNGMMIALAAAATAIYYFHVKDDPAYTSQTDYMKRNYWIIPTGQDADGHDTVLTIHKPYDLPSVAINSVEGYLEAVRRNDPQAWWAVAKSIRDAFPREFGSVNEALSAFPPIKTAYELATGTKLGFEGHAPSPIIPEALKTLPPEMQSTAMTAGIFKKLGGLLGVSPMMLAHAYDSMGGTFGQDVKDISSAVFDGNPLQSTRSAMNRFFLGQLWRTERGAPGVSADMSDLMARDHGQYQVLSAGYKKAKELGDQDEAQSIYNRADNTAKTMMTLDSSYKFTPAVRQLQPLERSQAIAGILYQMMRNLGNSQIQIADRTQKKGDVRQVINLAPDQARQLNVQFSRILTDETRNGLIISGQPGYSDMTITDTSPRMDMIKEINPAAAAELSSRMGKAHILPASGVAAVWPEVQDRLLKDRDSARLGDLVAKAKGLVN